MSPMHPELNNANMLLMFIGIQLSIKKTVIQKAKRAIKALNEFIQKGEIFRANSVKIVLEYEKQSVATKA